MGKQSKKKNQVRKKENEQARNEEISDSAELKFKGILRFMTWIVGISFSLIIILPNFEFQYIDITVKVIFYIGFLTLLSFAFVEFFADGIKRLLTRK